MPKDLSYHHEPLNSDFSNTALAAAHLLSGEQCNFYRDNGYVSGIKILDGRQIEALHSDLEDLMKPGQAANPLFYEYHLNESGDESTILFHALGAWRVSEAFHDLLFHPGFTAPAGQLLDGGVRFWHDQIFVKPAHDGGAVAWHQDYSYWTRTKPMAHLTCWIALDDSTQENGCVHYVPGSHKWNLLPRSGLADDMDAVFRRLDEDQRAAFNPVPIELRAGEASFHHPLMIHGSYENWSSRPRRAAVINVFRDGVISDTDEPLLAGISVIPKGERIEGRFFPLLV